DADVHAVDALYAKIKRSGTANVLCLAADVTDPSPAMGWQLAERPDLLARLRSDLVLALALVHHVVVSGHAPLDAFLALCARLGDRVVLEWVDRADPM